MYIFTITYNFSGDYIAKKCNTHEEALKMLNTYLNKEIETVKREGNYTPSVLTWGEDDITLVYGEGYSTEDEGYTTLEDCAFYRIFEVDA